MPLPASRVADPGVAGVFRLVWVNPSLKTLPPYHIANLFLGLIDGSRNVVPKLHY